MKTTIAGFLTLLLAGFSSIQFSFADEPPRDRKDLRVGSSISITPIDLIDLHYVEEWEAYSAIYDTLFQYKIDTGFAPIIAQTWSFDSHNKIITFKIKPNLKFSDSSPLTAQDVIFSLKRMIVLDHSSKHAITRCFGRPNEKFHSPTQFHPLIQAPDSFTVRLGPSGCGESFLKDLAEGAYGIVSPKSVDKKFKLLPSGPTSGAFVLSLTSNRFLMEPNLMNWRWARKPLLTGIEITKINNTSQDLNKNLDLDFFRTADPDLVENAKKTGFKVQISLPIMVWYLAPKIQSDTKIPWQTILKDINQNLDRNKIGHFKDNMLERPAQTFFPDEYNCDKKPPSNRKFGKPFFSKTDRGRITIELIDHKSEESKLWLAGVGDLLEDLGYKTKIVHPDMPIELPETTLRLQSYRQFLGDGNINSLTFAFNTIHAIPDPSGNISTLLKKIEKSEHNQKALTLTTNHLCERLYQFNHIPIAHRKIAFLARNEKYFQLFGRSNGNIFLADFPHINEGQ